MNSKRFSDFEARLEQLVEGSFARLFRGGLRPREVAIKLLRAIEDNVLTGANDREAAPTQYKIRLHPEDLRSLTAQTPDLASKLSAQVINYCQESGLHLMETPEVILLADESIELHTLVIQAHHVITRQETTQLMAPVHQMVPAEPPPEASLQIDGDRVVRLDGPVFNMGRHPDNDLVLSDLRVSRHHVQLRLRHGRYVLFDRQSRAGTFVNDQQVKEHTLSDGDVLNIGGITIVYQERKKPVRNIRDTQIDLLPPDSPEGA